MRITYLHQYFNTPEMSGGTRSYEMARRLVAMGHEVNMVTSWREEGGERDWYETEEAGIRVHWLPVPYSNHMSYSERMRAFVRFAWQAARKAASIPADVVFATSTPLTIALPGAYAARKRKVPMVFEVRDLWPDVPIAMGALPNPVMRIGAKRLEDFAYRRSNRIVALSPGMKEGVVSSGVPPERVAVIPNSSDLELFDPDTADRQLFREVHPELGKGPLVVYGGTMGRVNGVGYLARIASAAKQHGSTIQFVVVGRGAEEEEVRKIASDEGVLGVNFHLYPPLPKKEMPNLLAAADVSVSLVINVEALWANSANKFFDALASGTPMAINHGGWQAELLRDTGAGLVLPPDAPEEAAARLEAFLSDREGLQGAGEAARELARSRFSRDDLAVQLERVLQDAVAAGGKGA